MNDKQFAKLWTYGRIYGASPTTIKHLIADPLPTPEVPMSTIKVDNLTLSTSEAIALRDKLTAALAPPPLPKYSLRLISLHELDKTRKDGIIRGIGFDYMMKAMNITSRLSAPVCDLPGGWVLGEEDHDDVGTWVLAWLKY